MKGVSSYLSLAGILAMMLLLASMSSAESIEAAQEDEALEFGDSSQAQNELALEKFLHDVNRRRTTFEHQTAAPTAAPTAAHPRHRDDPKKDSHKKYSHKKASSGHDDHE